MTAGGNTEIRRENGGDGTEEVTRAVKPQIDPLFPCGILPVPPERTVFDRRKIHPRSPFQLSAAMGAGAGIVMHEVNGIICRDTRDACVADKRFQIIAVCFNECGIPEAKALCRILREVEDIAAFDIDHTPIIQAGAVIFPGCRRLS